jgi:MFS transporter, ACS family, hexuronate transporter
VKLSGERTAVRAPGGTVTRPAGRFTLPGLRWYIVGLLCLSTVVNYLDRQTLSVLAQTIQDEFGITTVQYSHITSAFLFSYTLMYAVSGRVVDWLGTRRSLAGFLALWSVATALHFFARAPSHFMAARLLLGAAQPGNFPAGVKAVTEWFPMRERALAVGIFNSGTAIGAAIAAPFVALISLAWGWRFAFVAAGALGVFWLVLWLVFYRSPREHPWLDPRERDLIAGDQRPAVPGVPAATLVPWRAILRMRAVWGCIVARMLTDPVSYFFIFWTPKYLQQEQGFDLAAIGRYSWVPFLALALGNLAGGAIPAAMVRRGTTLNFARKTVMLLASCVMPIACLVIVQTRDPLIAVGLVSAAMFAHAAWANITLPAESLPSSMIGTVTGIAGALGGITGIITQQAIGWTVQNLSFTPVFVVCGFVHLTALALVSALVGQLGRIHEPPRLAHP